MSFDTKLGLKMNRICAHMKHLLFVVFLAFGTSAFAQSADCRSGYEAMQKELFFLAIGPLTQCLNGALSREAKIAVLQLRAQAWSNLGQPARALEDQERAIAVEKPKTAWPFIMLSVFHRQLRDYEKALSALAIAKGLDEDGPGTGPGMAVYYHTGWTLQEKGKHQEAIEAFSIGISKQPDYAYALFKRGLSYEALGDRVQAKRDFHGVFEREPRQGYEEDIVLKLIEYGFMAKVRRREAQPGSQQDAAR